MQCSISICANITTFWLVIKRLEYTLFRSYKYLTASLGQKLRNQNVIAIMQRMEVFFLNYEPKLQNVADQSQEMYFFD